MAFGLSGSSAAFLNGNQYTRVTGAVSSAADTSHIVGGQNAFGGSGSSPTSPFSTRPQAPASFVGSSGASVTPSDRAELLNFYSFYGGSASGSSPSTPQQLEYIDAPLAEQYGMDATTAYQEALSNTAMRRHMNDLKAAGLNPILGMSGSGSGGVYSATPLAVDSGGSSTGGAYGSAGSGKSAFDMKGTAKSLSYWLPTLVNGVTTGVVTLKTGNGMTGYGAGQVAQNLVSGLLGAIRNS